MELSVENELLGIFSFPFFSGLFAGDYEGDVVGDLLNAPNVGALLLAQSRDDAKHDLVAQIQLLKVLRLQNLEGVRIVFDEQVDEGHFAALQVGEETVYQDVVVEIIEASQRVHGQGKAVPRIAEFEQIRAKGFRAKFLIQF